MSTTSIATGKLGKLPVRTDVRTLWLSRYVGRGEAPAPAGPARPHASASTSWPMYANDTRGDCTTAAAAHMIERLDGGRARRERRGLGVVGAPRVRARQAGRPVHGRRGGVHARRAAPLARARHRPASDRRLHARRRARPASVSGRLRGSSAASTSGFALPLTARGAARVGLDGHARRRREARARGAVTPSTSSATTAQVSRW